MNLVMVTFVEQTYKATSALNWAGFFLEQWDVEAAQWVTRPLKGRVTQDAGFFYAPYIPAIYANEANE